MLPVTDYTLFFTIVILVILVAPLLAAKTKVPDLVLILLAGAALGPTGFGVLERNMAIRLFGEVGLIYIMFLAGLEIDLYQFSKTRRGSIGFGLLTFAVPQALGTFAGREILGLSWTASLLIGSMFASHTLLSYPVASRLGIHRTEPVTVTVGATIITDTLALLVLALVADAAQGIPLGLALGAEIALGMAALTFVALWVIPRMARWFFQNVTESGGTQFLFVLGTACACGYLAHFARLHPIIGAFLAGAAFNRLIPEHSPLMNRVQFVGHSLFIPFFLLSVGMLVDYRALLAGPEAWLTIGVMVGTVILGKYAAAAAGAAWLGCGRDGRNVMFGLSVVQAAATLAAALVGFELKILDHAALNGAIAMILVTCPLGSWLVDRSGRRMALGLLAQPAGPAVEQRLLLSVANPASAARLMDLAFLLRDPATPGAIYPITIVREETDLDESVARGEKLLAQCMAQAASADVNVVPSVRVDLNPSDGIARAAAEVRATQVLVGWGGELTAGARLFGTVNRNLADHCPSRLLLCRILRPLNTTRVLHLPVPPLAELRGDFRLMLREVKLLAKQVGATLHVHQAGPSSAQVQAWVKETPPGCPTRFFRAETWAEARAELQKQVHPDDLILLPQERRNTALWTPTLDRLPNLLASEHPENNLIVAYPALANTTSSGTMAVPDRDAVRLAAFRPVDLPDGLNGAEAIRRLVQEGLSSDPDMVAAAEPLLLSVAERNPVELSPGIVLLHAHCGKHASAEVLIGKGLVDWDYPEPAVTPRLLVVLLSPKGMPPAVHLRTLADLARRFRSAEIGARLLQFRSAEEVRKALERQESP